MHENFQIIGRLSKLCIPVWFNMSSAGYYSTTNRIFSEEYDTFADLW